MNIKSLLLGSAAAAVAATGAQAADAIIFAEPEPLEYVRICDTYGAGFFYIPGTQNCIKIGGYARVEIGSTRTVAGTGAGPGNWDGFGSLARFTPTIDVRQATEWGTLRAYGEIDFNVGTNQYATGNNVIAALIDIGDENYFRIGHTWSPYAMWIRGSGAYTLRGGGYHLTRNNFAAYYFNSTNTTGPVGRAGFAGFLSVIDAGNTDAVDLEAGLGYDWGGGWIRAAAYYDDTAAPRPGSGAVVGSAWGAKIGLGATVVQGLDLTLTALYSADPERVSRYNLGGADWSINAGARYTISPEFAINGGLEWYNRTAFTTADSYQWVAAAGVQWQPFGNNSLQIIPEIQYGKTYSVGGVPSDNLWAGVVRFNRNF